MPCPVTTDVALAAAVIRRGGIVAVPTETVYGLGGNALDRNAVARIFAAKQRPTFDPLIVHVPDFAAVSAVASEISEPAERLARRFWPGPLTIVLPKQAAISELVTSGLPTVGVRVPRHPLMQELLTQSGCPIAAPSANRFGRLSPTRVEHVLDQLGDVIDLVLDGGPCTVGVESTIVKIEGETATVLRPGGLSIDELQTVIPDVRLATTESPTAPEAPGMLPQHYAPRTEIVIAEGELPRPPSGIRWGLLTLTPCHAAGYAVHRVLSDEGDLIVAAARFFETLHELDRSSLQRIVAVPFPNTGLGIALNDRLRRAATK
ncbi:threonylcarbamoyl-AMP synthase [bacterium]|nr:threonylcarbamoyl-AMP synthase [bacterium]